MKKTMIVALFALIALAGMMGNSFAAGCGGVYRVDATVNVVPIYNDGAYVTVPINWDYGNWFRFNSDNYSFLPGQSSEMPNTGGRFCIYASPQFTPGTLDIYLRDHAFSQQGVEFAMPHLPSWETEVSLGSKTLYRRCNRLRFFVEETGQLWTTANVSAGPMQMPESNQRFAAPYDSNGRGYIIPYLNQHDRYCLDDYSAFLEVQGEFLEINYAENGMVGQWGTWNVTVPQWLVDYASMNLAATASASDDTSESAAIINSNKMRKMNEISVVAQKKIGEGFTLKAAKDNSSNSNSTEDGKPINL